MAARKSMRVEQTRQQQQAHARRKRKAQAKTSTRQEAEERRVEGLPVTQRRLCTSFNEIYLLPARIGSYRGR